MSYDGKPRSRSGPSLTPAERRANGLELVQGIWLPAALVALLDERAGRDGTSRTEVIRETLTVMLDYEEE